MLFAFMPLLFLACIVLYAAGVSLWERFHRRQGRSEPPAPARARMLELRDGFGTAESETERRPAA